MNLRKLYQWVKVVSKDWQGLTRHFRENVRVFSRAVVYSQSSQIRRIAGYAGACADSQRRRLQRFVARAQPMEAFFKAWTQTVVKQTKPKTLVLVVDETKLKDQFGVMVVGVAYQERCIPLAWQIYTANSKEGYPAQGQSAMVLNLLKAVKAGVPHGVKVRVLADRGIGTSPLLMRGIMNMAWTFLFRVTKQSKIIMANGEAVCFYDQVTRPGEEFRASGRVFKKRGRIPGHVRVLWGQDAKERWALVTNDAELTGWEYAQRMWVEEAFRDLKSHGWEVEKAVCESPERMSRLWIFLVVAYGWMLFLGAEVVRRFGGAALKRRPDGSWVRRWSLFREGRQAFLTTAPPS
jgi:Transposase DDE domain